MRLAIIIPVYNDWTAFGILLSELNLALAEQDVKVDIFAVDDGSTDVFADTSLAISRTIKTVEIIRLVCNVGHQRAIAIGMSEVYGRGVHELVCIMDSDGEDQPKDVASLLTAHGEHAEEIIVAERAERSEGLIFRIFYHTYKRLFWLLTGQTVSFGNFCLIPFAALERLVFSPYLWHHLTSSILRSRIPLYSLKFRRGKRYAGRSKMTLISLISHGLSGIAVFSEIALIRILLAALALSVISAVGLVAIVLIKIGTNLAIPGWASTTSGLLTVVFLQAIMFSTITVFLVLGRRTSPEIMPAKDLARYVRGISTVATND